MSAVFALLAFLVLLYLVLLLGRLVLDWVQLLSREWVRLATARQTWIEKCWPC